MHPEFARRGIGRALIDAIGREPVARERRRLTLTTFQDVPWNAPYYARLGFVAVDEESLPGDLSRIVANERAAGLHQWPRVVMQRPID